jgi:hypothetical protein
MKNIGCLLQLNYFFPFSSKSSIELVEQRHRFHLSVTEDEVDLRVHL